MESACKSVFTCTRELTSLPTTSRCRPRATAFAALWHRPWSHSSLISKQHFRVFTRLIQQLPDNAGARLSLRLMAGAQVAVSLCDSEVCFVCAVIIRIVLANSWGLPWPDKRSLLPVISRWWKFPLRANEAKRRVSHVAWRDSDNNKLPSIRLNIGYFRTSWHPGSSPAAYSCVLEVLDRLNVQTVSLLLFCVNQFRCKRLNQ